MLFLRYFSAIIALDLLKISLPLVVYQRYISGISAVCRRCMDGMQMMCGWCVGQTASPPTINMMFFFVFAKNAAEKLTIDN